MGYEERYTCDDCGEIAVNTELNQHKCNNKRKVTNGKNRTNAKKEKTKN